MTQNALDIDVDAVRKHYADAVEAYRGVVRDLDTRRIDVAPSSFGAGFTDQGRRIAEALDALHVTSRRFLEARSDNWERVLSLADDTVAADTAAAEVLGGVGEP